MLGCIALLERVHFPFHLTDIERNPKETCMKDNDGKAVYIIVANFPLHEKD